MNLKLIYLILALLSVILFIRIFDFYSSVKNYPPGQIVSWQTKALTQPKLNVRGQQLSLYMPNSQRVLISMRLIPQINYGDNLLIEGKVEYIKVGDGDEIAYMNNPEFKILGKGRGGIFIFRVREHIINFFNTSLPQTYSSLMLGIVFGIKEEMPPDFYLNLQKTGLMHVIAASGMNITMLGGFLSLLFAMFFRRQFALILTISGIVLYALLAGLEPSIVRASIMGILVFLSQLTGRQNSSFLALFFAAFLMLMRSPNLITDVGFQLSFLATSGLIFLRPIFSFIPGIKRVADKSVMFEDLTTTLTAQIMTMPILIINFGTYSLWSIPVNAIVLWTVPILMIIGGASALLSFLIEPIGTVMLYFSVPFLLYFTKIVEIFGGFSGQISIKSLPIMCIAGYYLIIIGLIIYTRNRK